MRHPDHTSPFDHEREPESELTQEFWGVDRRDVRWAAHDARPSQRLRRVDDTGSIRALRDGVAAFRPQRVELRDPTGQVRRTRTHGAVRIADPSPAERRAGATIGDLAAGRYDDDHRLEPEHDLPLTPVAPPRIGSGVDPLLVRLGVMLLVGVLLVPVALALRTSSDSRPDSFQIDTPSEQVGDAAGSALVTGTGGPGVDSTTEAVPQESAASASGVASSTGSMDAGSTAPVTGDTASSDTAATDTASTDAASTETASTGAASTDAGTPAVAQSVGAGIGDPATAEETAERLVPECLQTYTAAPGDSWYRIAGAAGVSPAALMMENRATVDTVIFAGDEICLPSGATVPTAPPTTAATDTTDTTDTIAPDTTAAPPATTSAPATTVAPTPSGSPGTNASVGEVKDVIRSIFPESEWETAFTIADRESRFVPTAYNGWCCYGVFQIYWSVHRSWLDDLGIDSSADLFDPLLNVRAAYAIWQRSGNTWTAWSTYDG